MKSSKGRSRAPPWALDGVPRPAASTRGSERALGHDTEARGHGGPRLQVVAGAAYGPFNTVQLVCWFTANQ